MPMSPRLLRPRTSGIIAAPRFNGIGAWFDATDSSSYTLDTGVIEWRCKAVSGQKFSQTTGASQPTINSTGIGGKAALSFNGSSQWMNLGSQTIGGNNLLAEAANAYSLYIVSVLTSSNANGKTLFAKASAAPGNRTLQIFDISQALNMNVRGSSSAGVGGSLPVNTDGVVRVEWTGSAASARFNSLAAFSPTVGSAVVEAENITLGGRTVSAPSIFWIGLVGEILFYNRILTGSEQSALFSYLNAKWGLSLT